MAKGPETTHAKNRAQFDVGDKNLRTKGEPQSSEGKAEAEFTSRQPPGPITAPLISILAQDCPAQN